MPRDFFGNALKKDIFITDPNRSELSFCPEPLPELPLTHTRWGEAHALASDTVGWMGVLVVATPCGAVVRLARDSERRAPTRIRIRMEGVLAAAAPCGAITELNHDSGRYAASSIRTWTEEECLSPPHCMEPLTDSARGGERCALVVDRAWTESGVGRCHTAWSRCRTHM